VVLLKFQVALVRGETNGGGGFGRACEGQAPALVQPKHLVALLVLLRLVAVLLEQVAMVGVMLGVLLLLLWQQQGPGPDPEEPVHSLTAQLFQRPPVPVAAVLVPMLLAHVVAEECCVRGLRVRKPVVVVVLYQTGKCCDQA